MVTNGPDLWTKVLTQFPPGAIIAGGAVRDFLLGVPPKDIDVFLPASAVKSLPPTEGFEFAFHEPRFGFHRIDGIQDRQSEYQSLNDICLVSRGEIEGFTVDLVEFTIDFTGQQLVETFDFWINQCWFDGELRDTREARQDRANNNVTICNEERLERSLARFERFNARHNGAYTLCRP